MTISTDDFAAVDIRIGTVVEAEPCPEARKPSYGYHMLDFYH